MGARGPPGPAASRRAPAAGGKELVLVQGEPNIASHGTMEKGIGDVKGIYDGELVFSNELMTVDV